MPDRQRQGKGGADGEMVEKTQHCGKRGGNQVPQFAVGADIQAVGVEGEQSEEEGIGDIASLPHKQNGLCGEGEEGESQHAQPWLVEKIQAQQQPEDNQRGKPKDAVEKTYANLVFAKEGDA